MIASPMPAMMSSVGEKSRLIIPARGSGRRCPESPAQTSPRLVKRSLARWSSDIVARARSFGMVMTVSTPSRSSSSPRSACSWRCVLRTERLRDDRDCERAELAARLANPRRCAGAGPPKARRATHVGAISASINFSVSSSAGLRPRSDRRQPPGPLSASRRSAACWARCSAGAPAGRCWR